MTRQILGCSNAVLMLRHKIEKVAKTNSKVLILGENGSGKELIARALHANSLRADQPFIAVNCAAVPEGLLESELFGHEKGAFTGAVSKRIGRFEMAEQGTLFLDEIGDMPLLLQAKLLRVLQDGVYQRVGGKESLTAEVRVIAATNRNLKQEIVNGRFREDLYYRLNVIQVKSPPLRDRASDIPLLVEDFVKKSARPALKLTNEAIHLLMAQQWPGNIRELQNVVERLVALSENDEVRASDVAQALDLDLGPGLVVHVAIANEEPASAPVAIETSIVTNEAPSVVNEMPSVMNIYVKHLDGRIGMVSEDLEDDEHVGVTLCAGEDTNLVQTANTDVWHRADLSSIGHVETSTAATLSFEEWAKIKEIAKKTTIAKRERMAASGTNSSRA